MTSHLGNLSDRLILCSIGSEGAEGSRLPTEPCVRVRTRLLM